MTAPRRFSKPVLATIQNEQVLGIRAGLDPHRFLAIWAVVVRGRVFVRPWNDKPHGWYRVFLTEPRGAIRLPPDREIRVRARHARGERLMDAVDLAYAGKFPTPGSRMFVRGLSTTRRRLTTLELLPR